MCSTTAVTPPTCCISPSIRSWSTSTRTRPSSRCASATAARSMTLCFARCERALAGHPARRGGSRGGRHDRAGRTAATRALGGRAPRCTLYSAARDPWSVAAAVQTRSGPPAAAAAPDGGAAARHRPGAAARRLHPRAERGGARAGRHACRARARAVREVEGRARQRSGASQHLLEPIVVDLKPHELASDARGARRSGKRPASSSTRSDQQRLALRRVPALLDLREIRQRRQRPGRAT